MNLKAHTNLKTRVWRINTYILHPFMCRRSTLYFITNSSLMQVHMMTRGPSRGVPATCSRSCRGRFSNCVASCTSPLSLARSRHWRIFYRHNNIRRWQPYKCRELFEWWLNCPPLSFSTILQIFWAAASFGCKLHKNSIQCIQVAWRIACM